MKEMKNPIADKDEYGYSGPRIYRGGNWAYYRLKVSVSYRGNRGEREDRNYKGIGFRIVRNKK